MRSTAKLKARCVNGKSLPDDIANQFGNKYGDLYNGKLNTVEEIEFFENELRQLVDKDCENHVLPDVSCGEVIKAIESLHNFKGDGCTDLVSDHLIHGCRELAKPLSILFTIALRHNFVPDEWKNTIITPIPKDSRKSLSSMDNYRAISLFSCVVKTYELVLKSRLDACLFTCDLQHGFKPGKSTNTCTLVLEKVASHYLSKGSNVYCVFWMLLKLSIELITLPCSENYCREMYMHSM